jgi:hypothetical protein
VFADVFGAGTKKLPYEGFKQIGTAKLKPEQKHGLRAEAERRTVPSWPQDQFPRL